MAKFQTSTLEDKEITKQDYHLLVFTFAEAGEIIEKLAESHQELYDIIQELKIDKSNLEKELEETNQLRNTVLRQLGESFKQMSKIIDIATRESKEVRIP